MATVGRGLLVLTIVGCLFQSGRIMCELTSMAHFASGKALGSFAFPLQSSMYQCVLVTCNGRANVIQGLFQPSFISNFTVLSPSLALTATRAKD